MAAITVCVACPALGGALALADAGAFNTAIQRLASAHLGRPISFSQLRLHLLDAHPKAEVENLVVGAPPWAGPLPLLTVQHLALKLQPLPLLIGRIEPTEIVARGLNLNLVRRGSDQESWRFPHPSHPGSVRSFVLDGGAVTLNDYARQVFLKGSFQQRIGDGLLSTFNLQAEGSVKGGEVKIRLNGGPLQRGFGRQPYNMAATVIDGGTLIDLNGQTRKPLDFDHFAFSIHARGPNLADLHYLFSLLPLNSRAYDVQAAVSRNGPLLDVSQMRGRIGDSDISGSSHSDRSGARPKLNVQLASKTMALIDMQTFLAPAPPHAVVRLRPGSAAPRRTGGPPIPPNNFDLSRLKASDFDTQIKVGEITGAKTRVNNLLAHIRNDNGVLVADPVLLNINPGRARIRLIFDTRSSKPKLAMQASLVGARLAALKGRRNAPIDGAADFWINVKGVGPSPAAIAADASGRAAFRIAAGHLPKAQAGVLGGDAMGALDGVFNKTAAKAPLRCAVGEFSGEHGLFDTHELLLAVGDGAANGTGTIDLKSQTYQLQLRAIAKRSGLFKFDLPVAVTGPLNHPRAAIDMKKDGGLAVLKGVVHGVEGAALTAAKVQKPPLAQIDCEHLLSEVPAYVDSLASN